MREKGLFREFDLSGSPPPTSGGPGGGGALFRGLSRSVQRDATGSGVWGGRRSLLVCTDGVCACVPACSCVMIGLDDALVTWAAVIGLHIDQFAALGGGRSPSWTCQMASHPPH